MTTPPWSDGPSWPEDRPTYSSSNDEARGAEPPTIDREEARGIAEAHLREHGQTGEWIHEVWRWEEITARKPLAWGIDLREDHWIAYVGRPGLAIRSSLIIVVHMETGEVEYFGSAWDEG